MKIIGVIPARYESSRFPGKPLALINGKPMIWWVYTRCKEVKELDELYVATDDQRIVNTCNQYGIDVILTSDKHKTGTDRVGEVASKIDADIYVNIQGDEPLIEPNEIRDLLGCFEDESVYLANLKQEIVDLEEAAKTNVVKIVTDINDDALYMSRSVIPSNIKDGKMCKTYRHIGIYGFKKDFLFKYINMPQSPLELGEGVEMMRVVENGYKMRVHETKYESVSVDLPEHIQLVEEIMKKKSIA